jgi:hypothetical protein
VSSSGAGSEAEALRVASLLSKAAVTDFYHIIKQW